MLYECYLAARIITRLGAGPCNHQRKQEPCGTLATAPPVARCGLPALMISGPRVVALNERCAARSGGSSVDAYGRNCRRAQGLAG